jgi:hypothetical protein
MDRGLVAPLSPNEEIALRRVAHGSVDVSARHVERLIKLSLVTSDKSGLRLTDVGVRRLRGLADAVIDGQRAPAEDKIAAAIWMPPIKLRGQVSIVANGWNRHVASCLRSARASVPSASNPETAR